MTEGARCGCGFPATYPHPHPTADCPARDPRHRIDPERFLRTQGLVPTPALVRVADELLNETGLPSER